MFASYLTRSFAHTYVMSYGSVLISLNADTWTLDQINAISDFFGKPGILLAECVNGEEVWLHPEAETLV